MNLIIINYLKKEINILLYFGKTTTMKKSELKQLIKEEISKALKENEYPFTNSKGESVDDIIYDALTFIDQEQLISTMMEMVESNPNITLLEFLMRYSDKD
jgi:hypothetical protein